MVLAKLLSESRSQSNKMPKKTKEGAEWVDDEVPPAAGEKTLTLSEKLTGMLNSITANIALQLNQA